MGRKQVFAVFASLTQGAENLNQAKRMRLTLSWGYMNQRQGTRLSTSMLNMVAKHRRAVRAAMAEAKR